MFCSLYLVHKREDMVPAGLNIAETMETGDIKNCGMTQELATNVLWRKLIGKVNAKDLELFWNRLVHEFYCLKVLITLEQVVKKKKNLNEQNFNQWADGEANWSGVVNFHCFIFSDDRNDMPCSSLFLLSGNGVISLILESRPLIFVYLCTCIQSIQKQIVKYHI